MFLFYNFIYISFIPSLAFIVHLHFKFEHISIHAADD